VYVIAYIHIKPDPRLKVGSYDTYLWY
jgi:hypothetical protein